MITCVTAGCSSDCQCVCLVRSVFPWIGAWGACCAYVYASLLGPNAGCAQVAPTTAQAGDIIIWDAYILGTNDGAGHIAVVTGNNGQGLMVLQANWSGNAAITTMYVPYSRTSRGVTTWRPPPSRNAAQAACQAAQGVPSISPWGPPFGICAASGVPVALATIDEIAAWYLRYLGRAVDAQGLAYWSQQPAQTAQAAIATSPEALARQTAPPPSTASSTELVVAGTVVAVAALGLASYRRVPAVRTAVLRSQQPLRPILLRG